MKLLAGKSCVITGGGSGVGRGTALLFAQHGTSVIVGDAQDDWAKKTVRIVEAEAETEAEGGTATQAYCDVSDEESVDALIARRSTSSELLMSCDPTSSTRSVRRRPTLASVTAPTRAWECTSPVPR